MSATLTALPAIDLPSELAHRENDGIVVSLWWDRESNACTVAVAEARSGEAFDLPVEDASAMDVFHHPFAYAAARGIVHTIGLRRAIDDDDGLPEAA
jgi:hypothetical protein